MTEPQWIWQLDRAIPSDTVAGRHLLDEVLDQLRHHGWLQQDIFGIHLAVHEAIVNAIIHGNALDDAKKVRVRAFLAEALVRIEIADEGPGFDPAAVPDPTNPGRLAHPGGRGVMLMRAFMSKVDFNQLGNQVTLEKQRSAAGDGQGCEACQPVGGE